MCVTCQHRNALRDVRHQQSVDDEASSVAAADWSLSGLGHKLVDGLKRVGRSVVGVHNLYQLHHLHRVEVVQTANTLCVLRRHRQCARVSMDRWRVPGYHLSQAQHGRLPSPKAAGSVVLCVRGRACARVRTRVQKFTRVLEDVGCQGRSGLLAWHTACFCHFRHAKARGVGC